MLALNPQSLDRRHLPTLSAWATPRTPSPWPGGCKQRGKSRIAAVERATADLALAVRPRVAMIEWLEPLMLSGNWVPEIVALAGGRHELTTAGRHSPYVAWEEVLAYDPQVIVVVPCGFDLPRTLSCWQVLTALPGWQELSAVRAGRVHAVDGNAYFNRSGPRLIDSLEILAHLLHPDRVGEPAALHGDALGCELRSNRDVVRRAADFPAFSAKSELAEFAPANCRFSALTVAESDPGHGEPRRPNVARRIGSQLYWECRDISAESAQSQMLACAGFGAADAWVSREPAVLDWRTWGLSVAVVCSLAPAVCAEVFHLANGGEVRGEVVNPDESPRSHYVVKTAQGGKISLPADQVKKVDKQSAKEIEYDRLAAVAPDTVKGQWEVAEFCHENHLISQRTKHLERIVQLDPDHAEARRALGYSRVKGKWVTVEEGMDAQGRKRYKGAWRLPQEIELMESARKEELAQKNWFANLKRWRGWFVSGKAKWRGPVSTTSTIPWRSRRWHPISSTSKTANSNSSGSTRLARIGGGSLDALVMASLNDSDEEVRIACWERLHAAHYKPAVNRYIQTLKHKDNAMVNLAAVGLFYMKDPTATPALIDALITTHKYVIQPASHQGKLRPALVRGPAGRGRRLHLRSGTAASKSSATIKTPTCCEHW